MSSPAAAKPNTPGARDPVTPEELSQALAVEVYDRSGKATPLGELVHGKRTALVFVRHFCESCVGVQSSWRGGVMLCLICTCWTGLD
jgi:hypothetical protein